MGAGGGVMAKGFGASTVGFSTSCAETTAGVTDARTRASTTATVFISPPTNRLMAVFWDSRGGRSSGDLGAGLADVLQVLAGYGIDAGLGLELDVGHRAVGTPHQERRQLGPVRFPDRHLELGLVEAELRVVTAFRGDLLPAKPSERDEQDRDLAFLGASLYRLHLLPFGLPALLDDQRLVAAGHASPLHVARLERGNQRAVPQLGDAGRQLGERLALDERHRPLAPHRRDRGRLAGALLRRGLQQERLRLLGAGLPELHDDFRTTQEARRVARRLGEEGQRPQVPHLPEQLGHRAAVGLARLGGGQLPPGAALLDHDGVLAVVDLDPVELVVAVALHDFVAQGGHVLRERGPERVRCQDDARLALTLDVGPLLFGHRASDQQRTRRALLVLADP